MSKTARMSARRSSGVHRHAPTALAATSSTPPCSISESSDGAAGRITVVLGRFDSLLSRGLQLTLREDRSLQIIGTDLDRVALEHAVASRAPRVAVLDEAVVSAPSVLEHLRDAQPATGIVVLAHLPTVAYGMRLFTGGVSCAAKEARADAILAAVRIVADGRCVFAAEDGHLVERSIPPAADLTLREMEVLEYLSRGRTHSEIADALQLGVETIRTHSAHIRTKLGVRRSRDLIGLRYHGHG